MIVARQCDTVSESIRFMAIAPACAADISSEICRRIEDKQRPQATAQERRKALMVRPLVGAPYSNSRSSGTKGSGFGSTACFKTLKTRSWIGVELTKSS